MAWLSWRAAWHGGPRAEPAAHGMLACATPRQLSIGLSGVSALTRRCGLVAGATRCDVEASYRVFWMGSA
jgi:hypothetical protein